ncbi:type II CAAX endopeptidase family protein [Galbibacter sp. EGI 63066]|uniref:CPBP family intramembrane glutamic endopeptidase n=1 Tax=Galbibacter sp. EGI 63066 TaxID=2993559 RepID=UPI0022498B05|nr:type II CAAX endopeptidase family protein [Galbibacter sp. EGI 63066]MCX2680059.1 type II CAAX endopeptidase family protein [Galbibacter sp. EGI 63066]
MTLKNQKLPLKWMYLPWLSFIFTIVVFTLLGLVSKGSPKRFLTELGLESAVVSFGLTIIGSVFTVLLLGLLLHKNSFKWSDVGIKGKLTFKSVLFALLGWIVAFLLFYVIQLIVENLGLDMFWEENPDFIKPNSTINVILILLGPVILASITEEIIFRGYLLNALRSKFQLKTSAIIAALVFASVHLFLGPGFLIYIFFGAFIPIFLYIKFESLYPAMLMHFFNNLVSYIAIPILFVD